MAMDRLAEAWTEVQRRYGMTIDSPAISARAVMGIALVLALEDHHIDRYDRDTAIDRVTEGTLHGFFPDVEPDRRRKR